MNVVNSMSWKPVIPQIDPVGSLTVCESLDAEAALKCQWTIKVTQGESKVAPGLCFTNVLRYPKSDPMVILR